MKSSRLTALFRPYAALWIFVSFASGLILGRLFLQQIRLPHLISACLILFLLSLFGHFWFKRYFAYFYFPLLVLAGALYLYLRLAFFPVTEARAFPLHKINAFSGEISRCRIAENGKNRYWLRLHWLRVDSLRQKADGKVLLLQAKGLPPLKYGDELTVKTGLALPALPDNPGQFNYRRYLQLKGIFFSAYLTKNHYQITGRKPGSFFQRTLLIPLRRHILQAAARYLPQPTRGVVQAIVLGQRQNLDRGLVKNFQLTGIVHVLAISGLHVGFILLVLLLLFGILRLPFRLKIFLSLLCLFLFAALVDFKAPVVRATLMASFYYLAKLSERDVPALNIIAAAGLLILLVQPQQILQPGFQFSFAAVFGILYGYPRIKNYFPLKIGNSKIRFRANRWLLQPALVSFTAALGTVPLTWYYFGTLQTGAILTNVILIPLVGVFVILAFLFIAVSFGAAGLTGGMGVLVHSFFMLILKLNRWFAAQPFMQIHLAHPNALSLLLLYLIVFLFLNLQHRLYIWYLALTVLFLLFIQSGVFSISRLKVTFVNVGQGDGCIVQFPQGDVLVVDAGDRKFGFNAGKRDMLPVLRYYGIRHIKYLLGTHEHSDHIGGFLTLLDKIKVDTLILTAYPGYSKLYARLLKKAKEKDVALVYKRRGQQLNVGLECRVYFLHPYGNFVQGKNFSGQEVNNSSLVCKIVYGKTALLLTGDLERTAEPALFTYGSFLKSTLLKVAHHGSKTSSSTHFLTLVQPRYSVISVGRHNKYFHPSRKTIQRLKAMHARPLRTDHLGAVVFESDGRKLRLVNWRK